MPVGPSPYRVDASGSIDRRALVARHKVIMTGIDARSPLSVGNGELCFTADVTGLQTFPEAYPMADRYGGPAGTLLSTQTQWGWHSLPNTGVYVVESCQRLYDSPQGKIPYVDLDRDSDTVGDGGNAAERYFRANPHRLDLMRLGLFSEHLRSADDLSEIHQELDLFSGELISSFVAGGRPHRVSTVCHPDRDLLGFRIEAEGTESISLRMRFPYGSEDWGNAADWTRPDAHRSVLDRLGSQWRIERVLDQTRYQVIIDLPYEASVGELSVHDFVITAPGPVLEIGVELVGEPVEQRPATFAEICKASADHWEEFWRSGGAVELAGSDHPQAVELERRTVLSQFLTAIHCSGSTPPAETGLMINSWRGKFHLEMHWWHAAHFPLWGRPQLLERSLTWYEQILPKARATARRQGFAGVRWPKQIGPDGEESPGDIGPFLVWQQPHPIYYAELLYRVDPSPQTLERYAGLVFETADFMASFASAGPDGFELGPPIIPAQESYARQRAVTKNPTFELAYWSWALGVAQQWRHRLGLSEVPRWSSVATSMAPLPVRDGVYRAIGVEPYLIRKDHPSMLAALGFLPQTPLVDPMIMKATMDDVLANWEWPTTWGWDYPIVAMTAARLGNPEAATEALLMPMAKNHYLANGHNWQNETLPIYLPGNGGLLFAIGLMAAGWDGHEVTTPGFGPGWRVAHEGLFRAPG